jgi:hypothetical protein
MAAWDAPACGAAADGLLRVCQRHGHRQSLSRCQAEKFPAALCLDGGRGSGSCHRKLP